MLLNLKILSVFLEGLHIEKNFIFSQYHFSILDLFWAQRAEIHGRIGVRFFSFFNSVKLERPAKK